jgi:hypothetical protein
MREVLSLNRQMMAEVMTTHRLSQRHACGLIGITRRPDVGRREPKAGKH